MFKLFLFYLKIRILRCSLECSLYPMNLRNNVLDDKNTSYESKYETRTNYDISHVEYNNRNYNHDDNCKNNYDNYKQSHNYNNNNNKNKKIN